MNVTVPVGVSESGESAATVATNVTGSPWTLRFTLDEIVVLVAALVGEIVPSREA